MQGQISVYYSVVNCVLEFVTSLILMFFHSVKEGAVGLSVVLGRAVKTADLVDGVGRQRGRRGGLRPGEVISDLFLSIDSDS